MSLKMFIKGKIELDPVKVFMSTVVTGQSKNIKIITLLI